MISKIHVYATSSGGFEGKMISEHPLVSVVVPCYNEQEVLNECHVQLTAVLEASCGEDYEIVYVNDGSTTFLSWKNSGLTFALVGDLDLNELKAIAASVS